MGVSPIGANSFPHSLAAKLETAATYRLVTFEGISGDPLPYSWLTAYINVSPLIRRTTGLVSHNANTVQNA